MKNKLKEYIIKHYPGMHEFRNEYQNISDKMLVEDTEMLIKLSNNDDEKRELSYLLHNFQSRR